VPGRNVIAHGSSYAATSVIWNGAALAPPVVAEADVPEVEAAEPDAGALVPDDSPDPPEQAVPRVRRASVAVARMMRRMARR